jgi:hypothetical protein
MSERRTVSYFEHEFHSTATMLPQQFFEDHGAAHMTEIAERGYDEVVMCVTELDIKVPARRELVGNLTQAAKDSDLLVTANPWRAGGVFGGEGMSLYEQSGGKPCICEPKLEKLLLRWLDRVAEVGIDRVFWDEPELSCPDHNLTLDLIDRFSQEAQARGILWNGSCIRSRDPNVDLSDDVASMIAINEIAVAPYPFHPHNPNPKSSSEVVDSIAPWFARIKAAADRHGIESQAWLQGFNINPENMHILETYMNEILRAGLGNIAVWGYNGCGSVTCLNTPRSAPAEVVWEEVCRLMQVTRSDDAKTVA